MMTGDQTVSGERGEAQRKRILRIVLGIIAGWNLLFIPLGIYVWPRLPKTAVAASTGASFAAQTQVQEPTAVEGGESPPNDDPLIDGLSRLMTRIGSGADDSAGVEQLVTAARQALEETGAELPLDGLLAEIENLVGGGLQLTPESLRESVATLAKRAEEAKRDASSDELELSDIGYRISKQNNQSWRFEWHCSIVNKTKKARQVACYVKFLDKDGAVVDEGYKLSSFAAGLKQVVRGTVDIDLPYARDVAKVDVIASPR